MIDVTNKYFSKNKKGQIWTYLIAAIIALVVIVIVVLIFRKGSGEASNSVIDTLGNAKDSDGDGVLDLTDKCKCDERVGSEWTDTITSKDQCRPCINE